VRQCCFSEDALWLVMKSLRRCYNKLKSKHVFFYNDEITAVSSEIHTKHTNTLCGQNIQFFVFYNFLCQSQWRRGRRRGSAAARLQGLRVRIPAGACMFVSCECCVLSGRGLCDGPITRPQESYRLWCVIACDLVTSRMRRPWPSLGCCARL
jgi:hypothetical protein